MADRHTDLQERREGDRRPATAGRSRSWPSTSMDEVGSSCHIHSSAVGPRRTASRSCGTPTARDHLSRRRSATGSAACSPRSRELSLVLRAVRQLLQAVPARLVGADRRRPGASTTARCGLRRRRPRPGLRVESPHPRRRRATPTSPSPPRSPPASTASSTASTPATPFVGNALRADPTSRASRRTLVEAIDLFERSATSPATPSATTSTTTCSTPPARSGPAFNSASPTGSCAAASSASDVAPRRPSAVTCAAPADRPASATGSSRRWSCQPYYSTRCTVPAASVRCSPRGRPASSTSAGAARATSTG